MMFPKLATLSCSASRSSTSAGTSEALISVTAATCIAVGKLQINASRLGKEKGEAIRVVATLAHVHMVIGVNGFL